jgi:flagellar hook-associated protein 3 FlgL
MSINATGNRMTAEIARQSRLAQDIARTQVSISTGKRLQRPSDDPVAAAQIARIAQAQSDDATWSGNLSTAASLAAQADSVLASLSDRIVHARELMVAASSGTATVADRTTYAKELRDIAASVADLRATKTPSGQPLFALGNAPQLRIDQNVIIAPVDGGAGIFEAGGVALTQDLTDAAAALDSGNSAAIETALARLGAGVDHVADAAADQGLRAARIDRLIDRQAVRDIDLAAERSGLEDTDLTASIARLNAQQLTLDAAQAAFARINRRSLFDLLG